MNCNRCGCDPCDCRRRLDWTQRQCKGLDWFVVSNLDENGALVAPEQALNWLVTPVGYVFDVPENWCLWSLGVDYYEFDGVVQIGANRRPIPVRAGVFFNLSTVEFPCPLNG